MFEGCWRSRFCFSLLFVDAVCLLFVVCRRLLLLGVYYVSLLPAVVDCGCCLLLVVVGCCWLLLVVVGCWLLRFVVVGGGLVVVGCCCCLLLVVGCSLLVLIVVARCCVLSDVV